MVGEAQIEKYRKAVSDVYALGNIESSYNPAIISLLAEFGCKARDMSGERGGQRGENIDIKLWRGDGDASETEPFGAVEVKKVGGIDKRALDNIKTEAARYGNVILTDNLVWEFWRAGEDSMYAGVRLMERVGDQFALRSENIELFVSLVGDFMLRDPAQIRSSDKLAEYMAIHAKTIRSVITGILKDDGSGQPQIDERQQKLPMFTELLGLYGKIKEDLRPSLQSRSFADMYAQTIVYGLFVARYNDMSPASFDRYRAIGKLQEESPLLSRFFTHITSTGKTHPTLELVIDKLCTLYRVCDISTLLNREGRGDAIVHFYEDFLTYYDSGLRKSLGVFYTPAPVVGYLVSAVDRVLIEDFGIPGGLSNNDALQLTVPSESYQVGKKTFDTKEITVPRVAVLDPACGTGTFHAQIIRHIRQTHFGGGRAAFYGQYIQEENGLLSRLIGFEIMMTSYVVAHLNIRRAIEETLGHTPETQLPTGIYLTNTLAPPNSALERNRQIGLFDFSATIAEEAYRADTWKTRRPIKVIIGNPPYLAASTNPYDISAYKTEADGVTDFGERKHGLNDDYVKFFRFAERIIEKNDEGILAFVSNNGFLDGPTFRGMRASLLRTFDKIHIVNLHGSAVKQEKTPDGGKDENIFDIMQGVSLFVGVRNPPPVATGTPFIPAIAERGLEGALFSPSPLAHKGDVSAETGGFPWAKVYYCDLWGTRDSKFQKLETENLEFTELHIDKKMAYFVPFHEQGKSEYEHGVSIADLFIRYNSGIYTRKDTLCIQNSKSAIDSLVKDFLYLETESLRDRYNIGADTTNWTVVSAKEDIEAMDGITTKISFRPFDDRWTFYTGRSSGFMSRPCGEIMKNFTVSSMTPAGANIGLVFPKGTNKFWDGAFIFQSPGKNLCLQADSLWPGSYLGLSHASRRGGIGSLAAPCPATTVGSHRQCYRPVSSRAALSLPFRTV